jgi:predicted lipoprotein with Yx(FWY)xxD motif
MSNRSWAPSSPASDEARQSAAGLTSRPVTRRALRLAGAGLLAATAAIHLDLYLTGYRSIPVIGWLFLLQVIAAFGLALAAAVSGRRLVAAAGAGFALSTLGGYLLSVWIGLFGFTEVRTTAGITAGVLEVAAFAVLAVLALTPAGPVPHAGAAVAAASVLALAVLAIAVAGAGAPAPTAPATRTAAGSLRTVQIGGVTVLANARGLTLYSFAPDTPAKSACNGSCAAYWPPVTGTPSAAPGVTGRLGTIRRADGSVQATYDGHPLYTYIGDSAPGQARGNNLNLNGGLWHEVPASR